jgi:hypothetical protein
MKKVNTKNMVFMYEKVNRITKNRIFIYEKVNRVTSILTFRTSENLFNDIYLNFERMSMFSTKFTWIETTLEAVSALQPYILTESDRKKNKLEN